MLLACLSGAMLAHAERSDRDKPIQFSADRSEAINYETKVATLSGNVIITQGTMSIHADRVVLRQNPDNTLSATAHGKPVSFRQKSDSSDEYVEGYALRAEYDGQKEVLELFDQALLKQGVDEIRSNYIYYNSATETFRAEGRPDSTLPQGSTPSSAERVHGTFQPKGKDGGSRLPQPKPARPLKPDTTLEPR
ncbi:MAG: lipopolysaccharide transport periplasmic protein LptA [Proteobacteria bacterium]|nr:lipopolysaccharide transport periplasmic protein LptA [Pseudomonadota bacterium]MCL2306820.1 lipopolysaccharide transport periplasmic protein LptA [Pseudomonadota bacterium]